MDISFLFSFVFHFSQLFVRTSQTTILPFCISFFLGMVFITASCTMIGTSVHSSSGTLSIRSDPLNLFGALEQQLCSAGVTVRRYPTSKGKREAKKDGSVQFSSVAQLCPTLSDPMDCSLPGSSIHGIFQARVLEWGAIAFSTFS